MTSDPLTRFLNQRSARFDRRARLRPMTGMEVVDVAVRAYQLLGSTILRLTAVPTLLCVSALAFVTGYVLPKLLVTESAGSVTGQVQEVVFALVLIIAIGGPLFLIGSSYSSAIITSLVSDFMVGNVPNAQVALRTAR